MRTEPMFRTKDLFEQHPQKPGLWKFYGRKDDIIVFSNGQKWNPVPSETVILSKTNATGVVIAGNGQSEPAVLIELPTNSWDKAALLDEVWPSIEEANSRTARYGRINHSKVGFVGPGTFKRTPKGTNVRRMTLQALQEQVDILYQEDGKAAANGQANGNDHAAAAKPGVPEDVSSIVRACVHQVPSVKDIPDTTDMFNRGLDSIEATEIARGLRLAFEEYEGVADVSFLRSQFIFDHPTIERLATASKAGCFGDTGGIKNTTTPSQMTAKYENVLSEGILHNGQPLKPTSKLGRVAITGTTGSLGSQILELLLQSPSISQIICLNRNPRAQASFESRNHPRGSKATFLSIDLTKPKLGLSRSNQELAENVDAFIHCAWEVNFSRSLVTFEHQISALAEIITMCVSGPHLTRLHFISSISAVSMEDSAVSAEGKVPAGLVSEPDKMARMGYAVSKNVGEHLLASASKTHGLRASVLRIGQIAGCLPTNPNPFPWTRKEWVPSLVDTSASLGMIPLGLPPVDWVPVDVTAQVVLDAIINGASEASPNFEVLNVVNPRKANWDPLATAIKQSIHNPCDLVSFEQWLRRLEHEDEAQGADLEKLPSLKTLRFLHDQKEGRKRDIQVDVARTCEVSKTFAALEPINEKQMKTWMGQWGYNG